MNTSVEYEALLESEAILANLFNQVLESDGSDAALRMLSAAENYITEQIHEAFSGRPR